MAQPAWTTAPVMGGIHTVTVASLTSLSWWGGPGNAHYTLSASMQLTPQGLALIWSEQFDGTSPALPSAGGLWQTYQNWALGNLSLVQNHCIYFRGHGWGYTGSTIGSHAAGFLSCREPRYQVGNNFANEANNQKSPGSDFTFGPLGCTKVEVTTLTRNLGVFDWGGSRFWQSKRGGDNLIQLLTALSLPQFNVSAATTTGGNHVFTLHNFDGTPATPSTMTLPSTWVDNRLGSAWQGFTEGAMPVTEGAMPSLCMALLPEMYNHIAATINRASKGVPLDYRALLWNFDNHILNFDPKFSPVYPANGAGMGYIGGDSFTYYGGPVPVNQFCSFDSGSVFESFCIAMGVPVLGAADVPDQDIIAAGHRTTAAIMVDQVNASASNAVIDLTNATYSVNGTATEFSCPGCPISCDVSVSISTELLKNGLLLKGMPSGSLCCGTFDPNDLQLPTGPPGAPYGPPANGGASVFPPNPLPGNYVVAVGDADGTNTTIGWGTVRQGDLMFPDGHILALGGNLNDATGDTFIELAFSVSWRQWKATNQMATFKASKGGTLRGLGNVNRWRDHYSAARFNEMRSQRRHATGSVDASGTLAGQANLSLPARRAALLALQRQLKAQVNCADGTLTYGDWSQCVRVEDFQAEINQAETGIDWSLSASYSLFPNEGGYATAEYTVNDREDVESGDEFFTFNGKISAPTQALATAKLNTLRTAVLAMYGWTLAQRLNDDSTTQSVYANGDATFYPAGSVPDGPPSVMDAPDGTTFIELSFSENYRRRIQGLLVGSTMQVSNREDIPAQTLMTTFAGTVIATGPSLGAAYATALAQAQALGANREPAIDSTAFLRSSMISFDQRQMTQNSATEFLRVTFSYEYQSKLAAGRAYLEMTTHVNRDQFGVDVETCSGFVAARDSATAQGIYAELVLPVYDGRLIHNQQTGFTQSQNQTATGFNEQDQRMEFNIQVYSPKLEGELGMKYSVEVTRDFMTLEMRTDLEGSCFTLDRPTADTAVSALMAALNFGSSVRSRRHEDRETTQPGSGIGTTDVMLKLDFQEDFVGRVTGQAGVNEMKLTEKVVYSETRWSVQNLPFEMDGSGGVSIPQPSGVDPGSRTVSGSVTAGTLATAQAWAVAQRALLTGDALGGSYPRQEEWETDYEFVPRIDGIPTGDTANVRLYRVNFTFGEILPLYPKPEV